MDDLLPRQIQVCRRFKVIPFPAPGHLKVGVAQNLQTGLEPIHGLRHPPEGQTTGWYLWAGDDFSDDPDFFGPLHVEHLLEWCPRVIPYLALPPGWRFLLARDQDDVWFDSALLDPE